jgi:hypothetical protein
MHSVVLRYVHRLTVTDVSSLSVKAAWGSREAYLEWAAIFWRIQMQGFGMVDNGVW